MQKHTVIPVTRGECGWTEVRRALEDLPDVSVLEHSSTHGAFQAMRKHSPDLLLVSSSVASALLAEPDSEFRLQEDRRYKLAIIAAHPFMPEQLDHARLELAGQLLWHDLTARNLRFVLSTLIHTNLLVVSPDVAERFIGALRPTLVLPHLSDQERKITQWLADGLTDKEIAERASMSERTVERLVARLLILFDVRSRFALGVEVARRGFLDPPSR